MSRLLSAALLVAALGLLGCSKNPTPVQLSGTVTYKGQPLHGGNMAFITDDHGTISTTINSDGTYQVNLPTGSMKVTIETESFNPEKNNPTYGPATAGGTKKKSGAGESKMKAERMAAEGKGGGGGDGASSSFGPAPKEELAKLYTKIPSKYAFKETSGLSFQITETGKQTKDFTLTD